MNANPPRANQYIQNHKTSTEEEKMAASVDKEMCVSCGICEEVCPEGAIIVDNIAMIDQQKCTGCGSCVDECPNEAISLAELHKAVS